MIQLMVVGTKLRAQTARRGRVIKIVANTMTPIWDEERGWEIENMASVRRTWIGLMVQFDVSIM